ncbi:ead/Ea22-like family protein [Enterobacter cloacae]|uniref:ead/Ea22-like family protein n=1 Tax=Enterobacter cloacae TaxID=550 RepID=UPI003D6E1120
MSNIDKQMLRERYSEKPAPKCHICGSAMTIQRAGAGGVVYGCTGRIDKDGEGYKFAEGRDFADDHYARSRVTVANESDPDVLSLLDELEAVQTVSAARLVAIDTTHKMFQRERDRAEKAEKRVAELEVLARGVKQFSEFQICHYGATEDYAKGYIDCQNNYNKVLFAAAGKGE